MKESYIFYLLIILCILSVFINLFMKKFVISTSRDKENTTHKLINRTNLYILIGYTFLSFIQTLYFNFYTQSIFAFFAITSFVSFYFLCKREKHTKEYMLSGINFLFFGLTFIFITFFYSNA